MGLMCDRADGDGGAYERAILEDVPHACGRGERACLTQEDPSRMTVSEKCARVQAGQRWLEAVVEAALAQASIALAARTAHQPALAWGTSEGTHQRLSLWLATEEAPRSLPFTRVLIEDCGAGARRRQTYARAYILRRLRQMGLFSY